MKRIFALSYDEDSYCLIVKKSHVSSFGGPALIAKELIENKSDFEMMDRLAAHIGVEANYMVWGFYG